MMKLVLALLATGLLGFFVGQQGAGEADEGGERSGEPVRKSLTALASGGDSIPMSGSDFEIVQRVLARVEVDGVKAYARAWKDLDQLPRMRRERLEAVLVRWWGAADGRAAMGAIGKRSDLAPLVMQGWGSTDPEAALVYAKSPACKYFYSMASEIVFGLWREDDERGMEFAREHGIKFPLKLYRLWFHRDGRAAMAHSLCDPNGWAFDTYDYVDDAWQPDDPAAELEWVMGLNNVRKESERHTIAAAIVRDFDGVDSRAVLAAVEANSEWFGRDWMASWAIERWTKDDPEAARVWFDQVPKDHEFRRRLVDEALQTGLFEDRSRVGELVAELPEEEREDAIEEVIELRRGESLEESLAWVDAWRDELSAKVFEENLRSMIGASEFGNPDEFVEGLEVLQARLPDGGVTQLVRRFGKAHPAEASAWVLGSELEGRDRYYALRGTLAPWLVSDATAAGDFMMGLAGEDRETAARAIVAARMPVARDRALRERLGLGLDEGKEESK